MLRKPGRCLPVTALPRRREDEAEQEESVVILLSLDTLSAIKRSQACDGVTVRFSQQHQGSRSDEMNRSRRGRASSKPLIGQRPQPLVLTSEPGPPRKGPSADHPLPSVDSATIGRLEETQETLGGTITSPPLAFSARGPLVHAFHGRGYMQLVTFAHSLLCPSPRSACLCLAPAPIEHPHHPHHRGTCPAMGGTGRSHASMDHTHTRSPSAGVRSLMLRGLAPIFPVLFSLSRWVCFLFHISLVVSSQVLRLNS